MPRQPGPSLGESHRGSAWTTAGKNVGRDCRECKGLPQEAAHGAETQRDLRNVLGQLEGKKIHRAAEIPIYTFGRGFIDALAERIARRVRMSLSVTERHLYLDVDGVQLSTIIEEHRVPAGA